MSQDKRFNKSPKLGGGLRPFRAFREKIQNQLRGKLGSDVVFVVDAVLLVSRVGIDNLLWRMLRTEGYVLVEHLAFGEGMQTRIAHVLCVIIL